MSNPFFDANSYPWVQPEAFRLYKALIVDVRHPTEIDLLYKRSADELPGLTLSQAPAHIWKEAL
jgi:hypothetical protein